MWSRTLVGMLASFVLTGCLMLNLILCLPFAMDVRLFVAYVSGFLVLSGLLSWFYCASSVGSVLKRCLPIAVLSLLTNVWLLMAQGS